MPPLTARQRAGLTVALSLAVFMNVLDLAIANVAIPQLAGELGTSADQGTWVITSFAVSAASSLCWTSGLPSTRKSVKRRRAPRPCHPNTNSARPRPTCTALPPNYLFRTRGPDQH